MKKADYSILAFTIAHEITKARQILADPKVSEPDSICAKGQLACGLNVAREFSALASVDKKAFLEACGIKP